MAIWARTSSVSQDVVSLNKVQDGIMWGSFRGSLWLTKLDGERRLREACHVAVTVWSTSLCSLHQTPLSSLMTHNVQLGDPAAAAEAPDTTHRHSIHLADELVAICASVACDSCNFWERKQRSADQNAVVYQTVGNVSSVTVFHCFSFG